MTDNELIKELNHLAFIYERLGDLRKVALIKNAITRIESRINADRFSMNIFELQACQNYAANEAVNNYKSALLKKIFPYDTADKKQYSISAYAVERAIIEVAEELYDTKRNN